MQLGDVIRIKKPGSKLNGRRAVIMGFDPDREDPGSGDLAIVETLNGIQLPLFADEMEASDDPSY